MLPPHGAGAVIGGQWRLWIALFFGVLGVFGASKFDKDIEDKEVKPKENK